MKKLIATTLLVLTAATGNATTDAMKEHREKELESTKVMIIKFAMEYKKDFKLFNCLTKKLTIGDELAEKIAEIERVKGRDAKVKIATQANKLTMQYLNYHCDYL